MKRCVACDALINKQTLGTTLICGLFVSTRVSVPLMISNVIITGSMTVEVGSAHSHLIKDKFTRILQ